MRDFTERISNEELDKFYDYEAAKHWPYNLVNRLINNDNKPKLPADWKHYIEEQLGFVTNVCGYKSVSIIKDVYKDNLTENDIHNKYEIPEDTSIYGIIKSGIGIMKSYNSILYHGFEFCNEHRTISSEFKNIDFKPEEIKALNDIGIWSFIQYIKSEDKIKSVLGWSDGKYNHFRKQMNLDEVDQVEVTKKEDISIKDSIESVIEDHVDSSMELKKFIDFANQIRKLVGVSTKSRTVSKSTKDIFSNLGYNITREKNEVLITKKGNINMEAIVGNNDSLNVFNTITKRYLIASGITSINDIPLNKSELREKLSKNPDLSPMDITLVVDDVFNCKEICKSMVGRNKLDKLNILTTKEKYESLNMILEKYPNGKLNKEDLEHIIDFINKMNEWDSEHPWFKTIDNFNSVMRYINRVTKFNIFIKTDDEYILHYKKSHIIDTNLPLEVEEEKEEIEDNSNDVSAISNTEIIGNSNNIITNSISTDSNIKKAFEAFLKIPAIPANDIKFSISCTCPSCNNSITNEFNSFDEISRIIYCPHCGCKLSF